jgi:murein DD-endopeptidase MepM/ murein hydrolase activator NlpD
MKISRKINILCILTIAIIFLYVGNTAAKDNFATIYHVYLNEEKIGEVDSEYRISQVIEEKIKNINEKYEGVELTAGNLSLVPEKVINNNNIVNSTSTINKLVEQMKVVAVAHGIAIDGQVITYLKSKKEATQAIEQIKQEYIEQKQIKQSAGTVQLNEGQTRLIEIEFSESVEVVQGEVSPDQLLSVKETVDLLVKGTRYEKKYIVKPGDVLGQIAKDNGLTLKEIIELNPEIQVEDYLQINQEIMLEAYHPYITLRTKIQEEVVEKIPYEYDITEDPTMYKGEQKVLQQGKDGQKLVNYVTENLDGNIVKRVIISEETVKEPVDHIVLKGTKEIVSRGTGNLGWPAVGGYISSKMGYRNGRPHRGIDIARPSNRSILAADNGIVVSVGREGGFGNKIVIDHQNGFTTLYAHLSSFAVVKGQEVSKGQKIGVMGTTGNSTGIHLHFEVFINGERQDPLNYVRTIN